jgi:hypothetical protein
MHVKRTLTLVAAGGAAIAWFAGAATSNRESAAPIVVPRPAVDVQSADLAKEIARLHDRLRPDATPRQPARNLFAFRAAAPRTVAPAPAAAAPAIVESAAASTPSAPTLKLDGIAEDAGADGPVRTAIISAQGQLFLAKAGDAVTSRYTVARIGADVVELTDAIDGSTRRLALK